MKCKIKKILREQHETNRPKNQISKKEKPENFYEMQNPKKLEGTFQKQTYQITEIQKIEI